MDKIMPRSRRESRSLQGSASSPAPTTQPTPSSSSSSSSSPPREESQQGSPADNILGRRSLRVSSTVRPLAIIDRGPTSIPTPTTPSSTSARRLTVADQLGPRTPPTLSPTASRHRDYVAIPATTPSSHRSSPRNARGAQSASSSRRQAPVPPPGTASATPQRIRNSRTAELAESPSGSLAPTPSGSPVPVSSEAIRAIRRQLPTAIREARQVIPLPESAVTARVVRSPSPEARDRQTTAAATTQPLIAPQPEQRVTIDELLREAATQAASSSAAATTSTPNPRPTSPPPPAFSVGSSDGPNGASSFVTPPSRPTRSSARAARNATQSPTRSTRTTPSGGIMYTHQRQPSPSGSIDSFNELSTSVCSVPSSSSKAAMESYATSLGNSTGPLACKAEIVLEKGGDVLELFGGPRTGASYSLPGHLVISVPNLPKDAGAAEQGGVARQRILKSLEVVFEGKSEFFDESGRYQCMRLIQVRKSILPDDGTEQILPHCSASKQPTDSETRYAMAFDMSIPGWLPATFENDVSSVSYGVIGFASVGWAKEGTAAASSIATMVTESAPIPISTTVALTATSASNTGFRTMITRGLSSRLMNATVASQWQVTQVRDLKTSWNGITINRHRAWSPSHPILSDRAANPPVAPPIPPDHTLRHFTLKPSEDSPSPVECLISVPDTVDINGPNLRVSVRIRARKNFTVISPEEVDARVEAGASTPAGIMQSTDNTEDVEMEGPEESAGGPLDSVPDAEGGATAGPSTPAKKIEAAKPSIRMVELGMEVEEIERYSSTPAQPFMAAYPIPEEQPNPQNPCEGPHALLSPESNLHEIFRLGGFKTSTFKGQRQRTLLLGDDGKPRSYKFDQNGLELGSGWRKVNVIVPMPSLEAERAGSSRPMAEVDTPYARIKHKLKIRITCRCSLMPGKDTLVVLTTPIRCGTAPPERRVPLQYIQGMTSATIDKPVPLPAYNQLFHENGSTREDDDPVPLYKEDEAPPYSPARPIARLPKRRSVHGREAMDISRDEVVAGPSSAALTPRAVLDGAMTPSAFTSASTPQSALPIAISRSIASTLHAPSVYTPSTSLSSPYGSTFASVPPPRPSPLGWADTSSDAMDMSPSSSPMPTGRTSHPGSDEAMATDCLASTSSLQDVLARHKPAAGASGLSKQMTDPSRLQLGVPPQRRRR